MSAEEVLLNFMGRPGYKPMRLEAIVTALGGGREDLMRLRKTMPRMLKTSSARAAPRASSSTPSRVHRPAISCTSIPMTRTSRSTATASSSS